MNIFFVTRQADLYAGSLIIQQTFGDSSSTSLYLSVAFLLAVAGTFTVTGGVTTVIWTDFVQAILIIVGSGILMVLGNKHLDIHLTVMFSLQLMNSVYIY